MKGTVLTAILFISMLLGADLSVVFAAGSKHNKCSTAYPIVLSHGRGARADNMGINYWFRIPQALEDEGARVFVSDQMAYNTTASRGEELKQYVLEVLAVTKAKKVNVIGHSHGTLDSRYMTANLGMKDKIASWTGIAGPNRGSSVADVLLGILPDKGELLVADVLNFIAVYIHGDKDPDSLGSSYDLTMEYMNDTFNPNTPDQPGVYYQSWAGKIKFLTADFLFTMPTWLLIKHYEGDNDCLVSVTSARWGNFRGVESGAWWCGGVSHFNMVDQFLGITPGFNAPDFYVDIVNELKDKGY